MRLGADFWVTFMHECRIADLCSLVSESIWTPWKTRFFSMVLSSGIIASSASSLLSLRAFQSVKCAQ